jgi:hypothetical protein
MMVISKWSNQYDLMEELSILEERIQNKIVQTKIKMDKTMLRAETRLWPIIETLKWILNEILVVSGTNQSSCSSASGGSGTFTTPVGGVGFGAITASSSTSQQGHCP